MSWLKNVGRNSGMCLYVGSHFLIYFPHKHQQPQQVANNRHSCIISSRQKCYVPKKCKSNAIRRSSKRRQITRTEQSSTSAAIESENLLGIIIFMECALSSNMYIMSIRLEIALRWWSCNIHLSVVCFEGDCWCRLARNLNRSKRKVWVTK